MAFDVEWFFAFVEEEETEFDPEAHARVDTELLGFTFEHSEGQFATLRIVTRNPLGEGGTFALGLLGAGRKQWGWFSWSLDGAEAAPLMFGRIVAVPTDVFGAKVTIDMQARPQDYADQKRAIADAIKAAGPPQWCPEFYDEQQREDPELVLESASAVWYVDPVTHVVSLSDILIGEGDALTFAQGEHRFDGLRMSLGSPPVPAVDVDIEFAWTQRAAGSVSIGISSSSYTLDADSYPKAGASFGDGWTVQSATVTQSNTFEVKSVQSGSNVTIEWWDGAKSNLTVQDSHDVVDGGGILLPQITTNYSTDSQYSEGKLTSWSVSMEWVTTLIPLYDVVGSFTVGYDAARPMVERVTYTLRADVMATVVLPEDEEAPRLEFKSVDLSEYIDGVPPIGDPRRRSYATQSRGYDSIYYSLLCGRSLLRAGSRAVDVEFSPFLNRLGELRLDKNAFVNDWRIPGGTAQGKITRFSCTLTPPSNGGAASLALSVRMGCAVGRGGTLTEVGGEPDYVDDDYIDRDQEYQERTGETVVFDDSVGFTPPPFDPNDDGLDFIGGLTSADVFEIPLTYSHVIEQQVSAVPDTYPHSGGLTSGLPVPSGFDSWPEAMQDAVRARGEAVANSLPNLKITFKLKDMRAEFNTDVALTVADVKIPSMIDLEATS